MPSTDANAPSSSGAVEAPVQTPTLKRSPRALASVIREAKAVSTAFGYPAPVNPLKAIFRELISGSRAVQNRT